MERDDLAAFFNILGPANKVQALSHHLCIRICAALLPSVPGKFNLVLFPAVLQILMLNCTPSVALPLTVCLTSISSVTNFLLTVFCACFSQTPLWCVSLLVEDFRSVARILMLPSAAIFNTYAHWKNNGGRI